MGGCQSANTAAKGVCDVQLLAGRRHYVANDGVLFGYFPSGRRSDSFVSLGWSERELVGSLAPSDPSQLELKYDIETNSDDAHGVASEAVGQPIAYGRLTNRDRAPRKRSAPTERSTVIRLAVMVRLGMAGSTGEVAIMSDDAFRQAVIDAWGDACLLCGRAPESWLDTTRGERRQAKLSLHHVNGDDTDDRVGNVIPLCQSCHVHVHRVDEPPYRQWHRQLPLEHRHAWNAHHEEYYEGPRVDSATAAWLFGDADATPESAKYRIHEPALCVETTTDDADEPARSESAATTAAGEGPDSAGPRDIERTTAPDAAYDGGAGDPETDAVVIAFTPTGPSRRRARFIQRDDGPGWWRIEEEWTGCTWRPIGREPVREVEIRSEF